MTIKPKFIILIIISITAFRGLETKKPLRSIYFKCADVEFNPLYLQDHRLFTKNTTLDVVLNVAVNFYRDPWVAIAVAIKNRKADDYRTLLQYDFNVCSVLGRDGVNFQSMWLQNFWKYGDLPKRCPIMKGNYSWRNLKADKISIPDFLPVAQYKVSIDTYFRKETGKESVANLTILSVLK